MRHNPLRAQLALAALVPLLLLTACGKGQEPKKAPAKPATPAATAPAASAATEAEGLYDIRLMTPETALKAALAAIKACRDDGFQVAVAVVDRGGNVQVVLRDRFAGPHTPETATRKAWTAVTFRADTVDLIEPTQSGKLQSGARHITGALMLGGGARIEAAGSLVGAIGISGAPTGEDDDRCARAGITAIAGALNF